MPLITAGTMMHQRQSMPELRMYAENTAAAMSPTYWWQVHRPDENVHSRGHRHRQLQNMIEVAWQVKCSLLKMVKNPAECTIKHSPKTRPRPLAGNQLPMIAVLTCTTTEDRKTRIIV